MNIFFGPVINAAKGIADRIYAVVQSFSINFYLAVSPQIVKSYASGDHERMQSLVISSTKYSFFLLLIISYPLIICMDGVLNVWLGESNVTREMMIFSQLSLVLALFNPLEQPITQMVRATGKIRNYQICVGIFTLSYLPIAILVLWLGASPQSTMTVLILLMLFVQIIRVMVAKRQMAFKVREYLIKAIAPIVLVSGILAIIGFFLYLWDTNSFIMHIAKGSLALCIAIAGILILGMNPEERKKPFAAIKNKLCHKA